MGPCLTTRKSAFLGPSTRPQEAGWPTQHQNYEHRGAPDLERTGEASRSSDQDQRATPSGT